MKYDWALVPDSIKWIAMDDDGVANGYFDEPCAGEHGLWCVNEDYDNYVVLNPLLFDVFDKTNWKDSLEQRPK